MLHTYATPYFCYANVSKSFKLYGLESSPCRKQFLGYVWVAKEKTRRKECLLKYGGGKTCSSLVRVDSYFTQ